MTCRKDPPVLYDHRNIVTLMVITLMIKGMMIKDFFGFFFIGQGADEAAVTWEPKRPKPSFA